LMKFEDCKYQKNILEAVFMLEEAMSELWFLWVYIWSYMA
jgi:hypothetical protein